MRFRSLGQTGIELSLCGLGGHEFLPNGTSRGFNEDFSRAVTPGELFAGFGGEKRKSVLAAAYAAGINFFDATIDSEKEALGRNLRELQPPGEIYVQTRPEGMGYSYDLHNRKMADSGLLWAEVERILGLLRRDRIDFLNLPFMASALEQDPRYLDKIAGNIAALKEEGLIRFACADTFSGEDVYLRQIEAGCFDAIFINFNVVDDGGARRVLPAAAARGMGVFCREAFLKGVLFALGAEAGLTDRDQLARVALKWVLSHSEVTTVVVGADSPEQLAGNLRALEDLVLSEEDERLLQTLKATPGYRAYQARKTEAFFGKAG